MIINSKNPFSKGSINVDRIFHPSFTPLDKYIIKGDDNSLKELPEPYINKIIQKYNTFTKEISKTKTLYSIGLNNGDKNDKEIDDDDKSVDVEVEEGENEEESIEILRTLYNEGTTDDSENKNVDIFLSENQKKLFKLEDNNKYIYSLKECHPFSMFYQTKYAELIKKDDSLNLPAPRLINNESWMKEPNLSFDSIFKSMSIIDKKV